MEEVKEGHIEDILNILAKHSDGLSDSEFDKLIELPRDEKTDLLNSLLAEGRITLFQRNDGEFMYKYQSKEKAEKYKELTSSEVPIYQLLEEATDRGLTTKEIKDKTGITTAKINKILGSMENKGLIKAFKSIQGKKRKVFMLSEIEPSTEITGGIWYSELEFNKQLIDTLCEKCIEFIRKKNTATRKEITLHIRSLGMLQGAIKEEEVQSILNILQFDDKIEVVKNRIEIIESALSAGNKAIFNKTYKVKKRYEPEVVLLSVPCTYCPLIKECYPDGVISPNTCLYFKEWLSKSNT